MEIILSSQILGTPSGWSLHNPSGQPVLVLDLTYSLKKEKKKKKVLSNA